MKTKNFFAELKRRKVYRVAVTYAIGGWLAGRRVWANYHFRAAEKAIAGRAFAEAQAHLRNCLAVGNSGVSIARWK